MMYYVLFAVLLTLSPTWANSRDFIESMLKIQRDLGPQEVEGNYASFIKKYKPALAAPSRPAPTETAETDFDAMEKGKALACSKLTCDKGRGVSICACNFNTGKVASFKNECDLRKHNCRFDTDFKVILQEVCPWEFSSRRLKTFNYSNPKYFNNV